MTWPLQITGLIAIAMSTVSATASGEHGERDFARKSDAYDKQVPDSAFAPIV